MSDLHLWRLALNPERLAAIAREQNIPASDEDHGYTVHALLCGIFEKQQAPKPWFLDQRYLRLWAYATHALDEVITTHADPLYAAAIQWDASASRPVPDLRIGQRIAFDLRACPVVRRGSRGDERGHEHDYLLWHAHKLGVEVSNLDPRTHYGIWLKERAWKPNSGADLITAQVSGWSKPTGRGANAWRGRGDGRLRLPDVHFTGIACITDPTVFAATIARGIGRHRAFGFGMLRLKPALD